MNTNSKLVGILFLALFTVLSCSEDNPFFDTGQDNTVTDNSNENENDNNEAVPYTIEDLQGTWLRTGGNHTGNEGMIMEVLDNDGIIVDPVTSGFQVDDVKWMNITPDDMNDFTHSELGSDYNYYSATINFQSDDVFWISVDAGGAGNYQEWTRQ